MEMEYLIFPTIEPIYPDILLRINKSASKLILLLTISLHVNPDPLYSKDPIPDALKQLSHS